MAVSHGQGEDLQSSCKNRTDNCQGDVSLCGKKDRREEGAHQHGIDFIQDNANKLDDVPVKGERFQKIYLDIKALYLLNVVHDLHRHVLHTSA